MNRMTLFLTICALASLPSRAEEIRIRVVDPQEAVIVGATVDLRSRGKHLSKETDQYGELVVQAELPLDIRVAAAGFDGSDLRLETYSGGDLAIRLRPATVHTTIEVVVRDEGAATGTSERTALEIDRRGARTVFDAVDKLVPGAYVTRRGVMGYGLNSPSGSVSIRGIGGSPNTQVLVVVDGRPDYMGLMGHPIPDFYTLSDVGSLSVTEGPASVRYGSGAMGGVIEIKPPSMSEGAHTEFTTSFGSFNAGQHRLAHGGRAGRVSYHVTAGIEHTSGDRPNSAFHDQDGTLALGYDLSSIWKISLQGRYGHFNVEDPGSTTAPAAGRYANVGRGGYNLTLDNSGTHAWGSASFFSSYGHHMLWDGFRSVDATEGFRLDQNYLITQRLTIEAGTDVVRLGGQARNIKTSLEYGKHHVTEGGVFSLAHLALSSALALNAGLRYDQNSLYGGVAVPEFGAIYRVSERYSLSAAVSKGFRNPTIRELYLFPAPNPALKPERLWNYQVTFQMHPASSLLAWGTAYYADANNLIITTGRFPNLKLENGGRALNRGIELNGRWQPLHRVSFTSGYAYLRSTNLAPYVPSHKLNYSLDLDTGRILINLGGTWAGRTWADAARTQQMEGYSLVTLKCTAPIKGGVSAFITIDNLLNRRYQVVAGYPMPGINGMVGFSFSF
jgi:outer membrane cobalamin receptor